MLELLTGKKHKDAIEDVHLWNQVSPLNPGSTALHCEGVVDVAFTIGVLPIANRLEASSIVKKRRYANQRISYTMGSMQFGKIISDARKVLGISQKDLAAKLQKEDGEAISGQYLNDIEHNRRNPPSEFIIQQLAKELKLNKDHLCLVAGTVPQDLQTAISSAEPTRVEEAMKAFRRQVKAR